MKRIYKEKKHQEDTHSQEFEKEYFGRHLKETRKDQVTSVEALLIEAEAILERM